ncbi:hypothetical protein CGRA01v4_06171 [Colletotrichum graminicola]|nr:hypothetical protein CGRA01v4_06171 [Colletotrichum graminicola]
MLRTCASRVPMSTANSNILFLAASRPTQPGGVDFVVACLGSGRFVFESSCASQTPFGHIVPILCHAPPYILCGAPRYLRRRSRRRNGSSSSPVMNQTHWPCAVAETKKKKKNANRLAGRRHACECNFATQSLEALNLNRSQDSPSTKKAEKQTGGVTPLFPVTGRYLTRVWWLFLSLPRSRFTRASSFSSLGFRFTLQRPPWPGLCFPNLHPSQPASEAPARYQRFSISLWLASWLTQVAAHFSIHHGGRLRHTFISHRIHNLAPMHVPRPSPLFGPALEQVAYRGAAGTGCVACSVCILLRIPTMYYHSRLLQAAMGVCPVRFLAPLPCLFPSLRKMGMAAGGGSDQTLCSANSVTSTPSSPGFAGIIAEYLQQGWTGRCARPLSCMYQRPNMMRQCLLCLPTRSSFQGVCV